MTSAPSSQRQPAPGRYEWHGEIASGGMASVHLGRRVGAAGPVAIKRLHPQYAKDAGFAASFLDEARLAARVRHPSVVSIIDVFAEGPTVALVMEYVHGASLRELAHTDEPMPFGIVGAIFTAVLRGLHAAHEATSETGEALGIVHRDVSPENIIVGADGHARVLDFGIAYATRRANVTTDGRVKGKLGYVAVELLEGTVATPAADVYAAGVALWETLVGERLFAGEADAALVMRILTETIAPPSSKRTNLPVGVDELVLRAVARDPAARWPTALAFAEAVEAGLGCAPPAEVAAWVQKIAGRTLAERAAMVAALEPPITAPIAGAPRASRRSLVLSLVVIAALLGGVIAFALHRRHPPGPPGTTAADDQLESDDPGKSGKLRKPGCDPPYAVDAKGIRHPKAGCP